MPDLVTFVVFFLFLFPTFVFTAPTNVVYIDTRGYPSGAPEVAILNAVQAGFGAVNLAFFTTDGPRDMAVEWARLTPTKQQQVMDQVHAAGGLVLVSAGGAFDIPFLKMDGKAYGTLASTYAVQNHLDGVDFDLENLKQGFVFEGLKDLEVIAWLTNATLAASQILSDAHSLGMIGVPHVTHAPQAPYFGKIGNPSAGDNPWTGPSGGYTAVYNNVKDHLSWFNVQFYNQGPNCYTNYNSLFIESNGNNSCPDFPGTSVQEIVKYGVDLNKIVVGKYVCGQGANGFVVPSDMCKYRVQAGKDLGWSSGVMLWEWMPGDCSPDTGAYIKAAYQC